MNGKDAPHEIVRKAVYADDLLAQISGSGLPAMFRLELVVGLLYERRVSFFFSHPLPGSRGPVCFSLVEPGRCGRTPQSEIFVFQRRPKGFSFFFFFLNNPLPQASGVATPVVFDWSSKDDHGHPQNPNSPGYDVTMFGVFVFFLVVRFFWVGPWICSLRPSLSR